MNVRLSKHVVMCFSSLSILYLYSVHYLPAGDKLVFTDEVEAIQKEVDALIADGVNKIIALGHAGFAKDLVIAKEVNGLDVVIGGKSHTLLYNGLYGHVISFKFQIR